MLYFTRGCRILCLITSSGIIESRLSGPMRPCVAIITANALDSRRFRVNLNTALWMIHRCAFSDFPFLHPNPLHTREHGLGVPVLSMPVKVI